MITLYLSEDGQTQYGEQYKHLAAQTVEMEEPTPGENEAAKLSKDDQGNWVWEYVDTRTDEQKRISDLEDTVAQLMMGGV